MIRIWVLSVFLLTVTIGEAQKPKVSVGAEQLNQLLPMLKGKRVGLVVNNTSLVGKNAFGRHAGFLPRAG